MWCSQFSVGQLVDVQYEVFCKNAPAELHWYAGSITSLVLESEEALQVTVKFKSSEDFPECEESFVLHKNMKLTREGKQFPYRLLDEHGNVQGNPLPPTQSSSSSDINSIFTRLSSLEERLGRMEKEGKEEISALYLTLCGLLNASFRKYTSTKHKFAIANDEICPSTLSASVDCSYSDFQPLFRHIKSLTNELSINGLGDRSTVPSTVTITFRSFYTFCTAFSITDNHFKSLLSTQHKTRKGELSSFKAVGTVAHDKMKPSLPSILCIGGSADTWSDENYFFYRENRETINSGQYVCNFQRLQTRGTHYCEHSKLSHVPSPSITLRWNSIDSNEYCRPTLTQSAFLGRVSVQIPCLEFNDAKVATRISKWLGSNSIDNDATDSSSSGC